MNPADFILLMLVWLLCLGIGFFLPVALANLTQGHIRAKTRRTLQAVSVAMSGAVVSFPAPAFAASWWENDKVQDVGGMLLLGLVPVVVAWVRGLWAAGSADKAAIESANRQAAAEANRQAELLMERAVGAAEEWAADLSKRGRKPSPADKLDRALRLYDAFGGSSKGLPPDELARAVLARTPGLGATGHNRYPRL